MDSNAQVEISIIVPVYNVEKYLERCLKSLISQTFENYEIILIDDGSSDNSGKICDDYAKRYEKIRVIHQKMQDSLQHEMSVLNNLSLRISCL